MKNLHLIATEKPSRLKQEFYFMASYSLSRLPLTWRFAQHIYITNSEEIKEGDFVYSTNEDYNIQKVPSKKSVKAYRDCGHYKKIILTTDVDLITDGVQSIDDEFLEWFVNNPICESVEVTQLCKIGCGKLILNGVNSICCGDKEYKIIIPKEEPKQTDENGKPIIYWGGLAEPKQETLEEVRKYAELSYYGDEVEAFVKGAKWQQERSYSEEEVLQLLHNYRNQFELYRNIQVLPNEFFEWFEQFKKK
jgi:hypothetical protein